MHTAWTGHESFIIILIILKLMINEEMYLRIEMDWSNVVHSSEFRGTNCSAAHTRVEVHNINYVPIAQSLKFRDKST